VGSAREKEEREAMEFDTDFWDWSGCVVRVRGELEREAETCPSRSFACGGWVGGL